MRLKSSTMQDYMVERAQKEHRIMIWFLSTANLTPPEIWKDDKFLEFHMIVNSALLYVLVQNLKDLQENGPSDTTTILNLTWNKNSKWRDI